MAIFNPHGEEARCAVSNQRGLSFETPACGGLLRMRFESGTDGQLQVG
jgi:hypothetical protein